MKGPDMKGFLASALLGVLLALPVAAQIAGSGQRTEGDENWYPVKKVAPAPTPSKRVTPRIDVELQGGNRASPLLIVDVRAATLAGRRSGIRLIRGGRVTMVQPGPQRQLAAAKLSTHRPQMKLIRVGASPRTTYTTYGVALAESREDAPRRPQTIRVNP